MRRALRLPPCAKELAQRVLVRHDPIEAAIEPVLAGHGKIHLQQLIHRAAQKPLAMNPQLAARIDQTVHDQQLKHPGPRHLPTRLGQSRIPERGELQPVPQPAPQEAIAEAARPAQLHLVELHGDRIDFPRRQRPVIGKETQLAILPLVLIKYLQCPPPGLLLRVVDLAEVEDLPLRGAARTRAAVLDDAEVTMGLPILAAFVLAQKHERRLSHFDAAEFKRAGLHRTLLRTANRAGDAPSRKTPRRGFHFLWEVRKFG
jgi:hypothetical protein